MPYLVDGNNVMGQSVGWHRDRRRARLTLLDELAAFAERKGASVSVVFDGAPDDFVGDNSLYRGVRVQYAARGSDADARIRSIVEASRERRTLLVVTSDRALADSVRARGARVVRSGEFRRMMDEPAGEDAAGARKKEVRPDDTAHWLRYFGVGPEDE
ncbi:MAG TPA: NYN domain-containing protein [Pyrinomonadaceae bacterium]|nr:NYN domain-containing protein [Pyrinomonadaceae bacterium]